MNFAAMKEYKNVEDFLDTLTFKDLSNMKVSSMYEFLINNLKHIIEKDDNKEYRNDELSIDIRNNKIIITGYAGWLSTEPGVYSGGLIGIEKELLKEG